MQQYKQPFLAFLGITAVITVTDLAIKGGLFNTTILSEPVKNAIQIALLGLVFLIGRWGLQDKERQLRYQWYHIIYMLSIVICILAAILDYLLYNLLHFTEHYSLKMLKHVLISPIFYLAFIFLDKFIPTKR
jgi:putative flippase GtrA